MIDTAAADALKARGRPELPIAPQGTRIRGVLLLLLGASVGYFSIYLTLVNAEAQMPRVSIWAAVVVPPALLLGLGWTLIPYRATKLFRLKGRLAPVSWLAILLVVASGLALHLWVENKVIDYGYVRVPAKRRH
jgi:hypothetical protein